MFIGKLNIPTKNVATTVDLENIENVVEIKEYNLSPLHKELLMLLKDKKKGLSVSSLSLASKITIHDSRVRLALEDLISFGLVRDCEGCYNLFDEGRH